MKVYRTGELDLWHRVRRDEHLGQVVIDFFENPAFQSTMPDANAAALARDLCDALTMEDVLALYVHARRRLEAAGYFDARAAGPVLCWPCQNGQHARCISKEHPDAPRFLCGCPHLFDPSPPAGDASNGR